MELQYQGYFAHHKQVYFEKIYILGSNLIAGGPSTPPSRLICSPVYYSVYPTVLTGITGGLTHKARSSGGQRMWRMRIVMVIIFRWFDFIIKLWGTDNPLRPTNTFTKKMCLKPRKKKKTLLNKNKLDMDSFYGTNIYKQQPISL